VLLALAGLTLEEIAAEGAEARILARLAPPLPGG
jgi:hypothetical protein